MRQPVTRPAPKASGRRCRLGFVWESTALSAGNERSRGAHGFEALVDPTGRHPATASNDRCGDPRKKGLTKACVALDSLSVSDVCVRHCVASVSRVVWAAS